MMYSLEPSYRKYVKGYGFMSFARNNKKQQKQVKSLQKLLVKK